MSYLPQALLERVLAAAPGDAWQAVFSHVLRAFESPLPAKSPANEVQRRDGSLAPLDLFVATAAWDLWESYEASAPRVSEVLARFWENHPAGKAVLVLDALSLRELPWLLEGARQRGYTLHQVAAFGAELPADTSSFARALGFPQRSALENNRGGAGHRLKGARTDCVSLPWRECADLIDPSPDWVLWHRWPDERMHALNGPGNHLVQLAGEVAQQLASDDFWCLVDRLATGRRVAITSDHGYAASGLFPDTNDRDQVEYLRTSFRSGRFRAADGTRSLRWVPPLDLMLTTCHGRHAYVLGRRKWPSPGGHPTLTHGGLSVLEVAVPFIELSRPLGS